MNTITRIAYGDAATWRPSATSGRQQVRALEGLAETDEGSAL